MYVQIVTYNLNEVSEQDYIDIAHQVAPQFNSMPGLLAKVWLENAQSNMFGALYFWEDVESMERFSGSDLFEGTYGGFANVVSQGYGVYEHLTKATQPMLDVLPEPAVVEEGWAAAPASPIDVPAPQEAPAKAARRPRKAPAKKASKGAKAAKAAKGAGVAKATKAAKSTKKAAKGTKRGTARKSAAKKSARS